MFKIASISMRFVHESMFLKELAASQNEDPKKAAADIRYSQIDDNERQTKNLLLQTISDEGSHLRKTANFRDVYSFTTIRKLLDLFEVQDDRI